MSSKYGNGVAVDDVIRDALRHGDLRTADEVAAVTGYSLGYVRRWLGKMPDVVMCDPSQAAPRAYRYRIGRTGQVTE